MLAGFFAHTAALADTKKVDRSVAARTAACKKTCSPQEHHGLYRSYHTTDPGLMSVAGRKDYAQCVRVCLAPLPSFYVQQFVFSMGLKWFGQTPETCLGCHVK